MDQLPPSLLDILYNNVIVRHIAPYLPISDLYKLVRLSKAYRDLIYSQSDLWRYLDLTRVRSAIIDASPIDVGGTSWRAERMDEGLTEDEFYSGPLRGMFSKLARSSLLQHVHILILDGLSVPADLVHEVICEDRYHVRILSIRECQHLNQTKLQQALRYAVRPTRPENTPRLHSLYVFGPRDLPRLTVRSDKIGHPAEGVTSVAGAQIGAQWNHLSSALLTSSLPEDDQGKWYGRSGRVMKRPHSDWPETLQACRGIIAFDAVLCQGPRHDITKVSSTDFTPATIATVALGPTGCEICGSSPEGPGRFGETPSCTLPLLAPAPARSSTQRAAQRPSTVTGVPPPLYLRCEDCLRSRWCERCSRFWCESCYVEPVSRVADIPPVATEMFQSTGMTVPGRGTAVKMASGDDPKIGVHRDCFDCGRTCAECNSRYMRSCSWCHTGFCRLDDEGSTDTMCGWCTHSGRRTTELY